MEQVRNVKVKAVAMAKTKVEGADFDDIDVDIKDIADKARIVATFKGLEYVRLDVDDPSTPSKLEEVLGSADAVISCIGNRQPSMARWIAQGNSIMLRALSAKGIKPRFLALSSFGIGNNPLPGSMIRTLWSVMMATVLRSAKKDLEAMESSVQASGLDYLIVRPLGVDPEAKPKGNWHLIPNAAEAKLHNKSSADFFSISKEDVALFMIKEALEPTMHREGIMIGPIPPTLTEGNP